MKTLMLDTLFIEMFDPQAMIEADYDREWFLCGSVLLFIEEAAKTRESWENANKYNALFEYLKDRVKIIASIDHLNVKLDEKNVHTLDDIIMHQINDWSREHPDFDLDRIIFDVASFILFCVTKRKPNKGLLSVLADDLTEYLKHIVLTKFPEAWNSAQKFEIA